MRKFINVNVYSENASKLNKTEFCLNGKKEEELNQIYWTGFIKFVRLKSLSSKCFRHQNLKLVFYIYVQNINYAASRLHTKKSMFCNLGKLKIQFQMMRIMNERIEREFMNFSAPVFHIRWRYKAICCFFSIIRLSWFLWEAIFNVERNIEIIPCQFFLCTTWDHAEKSIENIICHPKACKIHVVYLLGRNKLPSCRSVVARFFCREKRTRWEDEDGAKLNLQLFIDVYLSFLFAKNHQKLLFFCFFLRVNEKFRNSLWTDSWKILLE